MYGIILNLNMQRPQSNLLSWILMKPLTAIQMTGYKQYTCLYNQKIVISVKALSIDDVIHIVTSAV